MTQQTNPATTPTETAHARPEEPLLVGRVCGLHGVRGWIKVFSYMRPPEEILQYERWLLAPPRAHAWRSVRVAEARAQGRQLLAKLAGVDTRDAAEEFSGVRIALRPAQLPPPAAGEYYWSDLIGMRVVNREGVLLGRVDHLLETGANDVLALARDGAHGGENNLRLLPWGDGVVDKVDAAGKCIHVNWDAEQ
ncbi:MAG: ribosome maturation factor RimM [Gammaproteobacteria bacterium]|nr:ribosome maturation factor RimM [Gammaproteobacteria bacterium]